VYPALAVAAEWIAREGEPGTNEAPGSILWLGSRGGMEADLVGRAGLPFRAISASGLHGVGWRMPLNAVLLARGLVQTLAVLGRYRPSAILVTGGFLAAPASMAGWLRGVPVVMAVPDIEPGLALKAIAPLTRRICAIAAETRTYVDRKLAERVVVTGYPTRRELQVLERGESLRQLGLEPGHRTVLVTGGSRGARSINRAVFAALPDWLSDTQVIHLTGQLDFAEAEGVAAGLPPEQRARYVVKPYLHEMALALSAADLVVSRAGASVIGEYPMFGLPAVLVPYPYAWRYQKINADYLTARGAAVRLDDAALGERLAGTVRGLLSDRERLAAMRDAARTHATPDAAERIADVLRDVARG